MPWQAASSSMASTEMRKGEGWLVKVWPPAWELWMTEVDGHLGCTFNGEKGERVQINSVFPFSPLLISMGKSVCYFHLRVSFLLLLVLLIPLAWNTWHTELHQWIEEAGEGANESSVVLGLSLQLFVWKLVQLLINNNTRINFMFRVLPTVNLLWPHPI